MSANPTRRVPVFKNCKRCGQPFRVKPSHYDKKFYCGRECMRLDYQERYKGKNNPNYRNAGIQTCSQCKSEFKSYQSQTYCSVACRSQSEAFRETRSLIQKARWGKCPWSIDKIIAASRMQTKQDTKPRIAPKTDLICGNCSAQFKAGKNCRWCPACRIAEVICVSCYEIFRVHRSHAFNCKTCSPKCRRARIASSQKGSKSHLWKGGKTSEAMLIRGSMEYKDWRSAVFARDDYTCCICKDRGGKLAAHHIKPFSTHPELRLEVSNGITMCWPCHQKIKSKEEVYEDLLVAKVAGMT